MFIRLNFAVLLEKETREGRSPSLDAPRAGLALYLLSLTYYMLITPIFKPRLQGVNLVGHYAGLYFRVLCVEPLWGFGESVEVRMGSWRKWVKGALCPTREMETEEGRVASLLALLFVWVEWKSWHSHFGSKAQRQEENCGPDTVLVYMILLSLVGYRHTYNWIT